MTNSDLLSKHPELGLLAVSVPVAIAEIRDRPEAERIEMGREAGQYIAEHGDDLMFRSRPGASATAFTRLSYGLAAAAYHPGGVTFAGMHFCVDHQACVEAEVPADDG